MNKLFECAICLEEMKDPRVLACGHSYCKACLSQLEAKSKNFCPQCKQPISTFDGLPSNWMILKWLEETKPPTVDIKCNNCEHLSAMVWCENCAPGVYYCKECDDSIHSIKALRSHARITLKQKQRKPSFEKCETHLEENKFYCLECKKILCHVCVIDDHPQHKTMSVFKYGEIVRNEMKGLVAFDEKVGFFKEKGGEVKKEIKEIQSERDGLMVKVNELEGRLKKKRKEEKGLSKQLKKAETSQIVFSRLIEEMDIVQIMNPDFIELMKKRIKKIDEELGPTPKKQEASPAQHRKTPKLPEMDLSSLKQTPLSPRSKQFESISVRQTPTSPRLKQFESISVRHTPVSPRIRDMDSTSIKQSLKPPGIQKLGNLKFVKSKNSVLSLHDTVCTCTKYGGSFSDRAVIINYEFLANESYDVQFSLQIVDNISLWIGVGFVEKELLEANQDYNNLGHGFYVLSSNGYSWHSREKGKNHQTLGFPFESNQTITLSFTSTRNLNITNKIQSANLAIPNVDLYPVVLLTSPRDSVQLIPEEKTTSKHPK